MAAHEAYLTHSTACARSIRAQSTAPHRRSCTASTPAPHGRRALRSKQKMSLEQGALLAREFRMRKALALSFLSPSRVSSEYVHEFTPRYVVIRFDSRKPMFSVPLPPRPTAGFRLPHTALSTGHRPHRAPETGPPPRPRLSFLVSVVSGAFTLDTLVL